MSTKDFLCNFCTTNRSFSKFCNYFRHVTLYHANEPDFRLTCDIFNSCGVTYKTFTSYKMHVHRHHKNLLNPVCQKPENSVINDMNTLTVEQSVSTLIYPDIVDKDTDNVIYADLNNDSDDSWDINATNISSTEEKINLLTVQKQFTRFLLEMREQHILPQTVIQSITTHIIGLLDVVVELVEEQAKQENMTQQQSTTIISVDGMRKTIRQIEESIILSTRNEYQFIQSCQKFFNYLPPLENVLSSNHSKTECSYHVPIRSTLEKILQKDEMIPLLIENIQRQADMTRNDPDLMFSRRDAIKGKTLNNQSFLIQLYVDGIGVTNPIGPKKDQHKLTLVYFMLEDIPDMFRSTLQCINLVAICHTKYLKDNEKRTKFYDPIVKDLNDLQSAGLIINTFNSRLHFTFTTVAADNLAAHEIAGLQQTFSSGYFCRRCLITYTNRLIPLTDVHFIQRTSPQHVRHLQMLQNNQHARSIFGVVGPSPLDKLINFDVTASLPGDVMHDLFEGKSFKIKIFL